MKFVLNLLLTALGLFILPGRLQAQPIITRLDSLNKCPDSLVMPVTVENFTDVASMSLKINYDTNILVYSGYQNLHPALAGTFLINGFNNQVILSWFSLNPATIGTGTLVAIKFFYNASSDILLAWDDLTTGNCVYTDFNGNDLPAVFEDGYVHSLMHVPVLLSPPDHTVGVATNPTLSWTGSGCASHYMMEISTDSLFTNIIQSNSNIFGTSYGIQGLDLNTSYFWHVRGFNAFHTTDWSTVHTFKTQDLGIGLGYLKESQPIHIRPNPCNYSTEIFVLDALTTAVTARLYDLRGICLWDSMTSGRGLESPGIRINTTEYAAGTYYLKIEYKRNGNPCFMPLKLVITH